MTSYKFLLFALVLAAAVSVSGQTTKYNRNGDLLVMSGLIADATGCEPSQTLTGTILKIMSADTDNAVGYDLVVKLTSGKQQKLQASVTKDAGAALVDFEALMVKGRRVGIKARRCGSGGYLTVDEVKRL